MPEKMKAIRKVAAGPGAEMEEVDIPTIGEDEVLIRVKATSICGTDAHIYEWTNWAAGRIHPPQTYGHEFCGHIIEVGRSVKNFHVGNYVSADSHIPCGRCYQCRMGQAHLCANLQILGVDRDGSFAEYIALPTVALVHNPPALPPEFASVQASGGSQRDTDTKGDTLHQESYGHRGARPVDDAGQVISSHQVGAQQVARAGGLMYGCQVNLIVAAGADDIGEEGHTDQPQDHHQAGQSQTIAGEAPHRIAPQGTMLSCQHPLSRPLRRMLDPSGFFASGGYSTCLCMFHQACLSKRMRGSTAVYRMSLTR